MFFMVYAEDLIGGPWDWAGVAWYMRRILVGGPWMWASVVLCGGGI